MVFGAILGAGIGLVGGVSVGSLIFGATDPKSFDDLDLRADDDDNVAEPDPDKGPRGDMRQILDLTPAWTKWPDYERVAWMNEMIATLWPYYNKAIENIVNESVAQTLSDVCKSSKMLDAIDIEIMDLGDKAINIGGIKTYETTEDEVIIEAPFLWGSNAHIRVSARVRLGPVGIYVPVVIRDMQLHARARITIRPLVETLPCLGAVHISLIDQPHVDMTLKIINGIDVMALPGIHEMIKNIVHKAIDNLMLYPNQMSIDLMEGGGLPAPPSGMLRVKLIKMENLKKADLLSKNDAYCLLEVREGRPQRSKTVKSNAPVFEQEFHLIVDDPDTQSLKLTVKDDDFGWTDNVLGVCEISLEDAECVRKPRDHQELCVDLVKEEEASLLAAGGQVKKLTSFVSGRGSSNRNKKRNMGQVYLELTYLPFWRPDEDEDESDEEEEELEESVGEPSNRAATRSGSGRQQTGKFSRLKTIAKIRDDMKGLLTVTLTRCLHLAGKDTYVVLSLYDKESKTSEEQKSLVVLNDSSPRWGDKFDFVMINANSTLTVTVMEKTGFMESMVSMKFAKSSEDKDKPIGKLRLPVKDVVRNGRLKDLWPLQEVQQGEIALTLTWTSCEFA